MPAKARSPRSATRAEAVALPRRIRRPQLRLQVPLARLAPSRRSIVVGLAILAFAVCAYTVARETSMFAIGRIEVHGASPRVAAQVRGAVASFVGTSLVGLDGAAIMRKVDALPTVSGATYDRAFPHTLRISVVPERPAAVVRRGPDSWLVSGSGRVIERLPATADPSLPRIWVTSHTQVGTGAALIAATRKEALAVSLAGPFAARVATVSDANDLLIFHLRSGLQLVLGDGAEIRLKVVVATRALPVLPSGSTFLDVSVPGRPVSGTGSPTIPVAAPSPQGSSRG